MTDTPETPTFELTYEWPVVIILGSGERLNLSTLDTRTTATPRGR